MITKVNGSRKTKVVANWLEISALFTALATTLMTTSLIMYRIHSLSRRNLVLNERRRYAHVLKHLIQSCALHVVGLILFAIPDAFSKINASNLQAENALSYGGSFFPFTAVRHLHLTHWNIHNENV